MVDENIAAVNELVETLNMAYANSEFGLCRDGLYIEGENRIYRSV